MSSSTVEPHVAPIESGAEQHVFDLDQLFAEMIKQLQGGGGGKMNLFWAQDLNKIVI